MSRIHAQAGKANQASGRYEGLAVLPSGLARVRLAWLGERITEIVVLDAAVSLQVAQIEPVLVPGFIDNHVHGGAGRDVMDAGDAAAHVARAHARHGTTALLATTLTAPFEDLNAAFYGVGAAMKSPALGSAAILGVHLEGPFINAEKLGAQPPHARAGTVDEVLALHKIAPIRVITVAPELPGHDALIDDLCARDMRVQIGHSNASYEQAALAFSKAGGLGVTHVFNAMSAFAHRAPGVAGAALAHAEYAEVIADTLHVHPGAIRVALRAIPNLFCVSDATAATGMPDGAYKLGEHTVHKCMGAVRLADGTLAGSCVTMAQTFRNLVDVLGLDVVQASALTSSRAAAYLGLQDRGAVRIGAFADLVLMGQGAEPIDVVAQGQKVDR